MITAALIANIVLVLILLALTVRRELKKEQSVDIHNPNTPAANVQPPTTTPEWAAKEAQEIITDASKKADAIVAEAELSGIKLAAESGMGTKFFEQDYSQKIEQTVKTTQQQYIAELQKILATHKEFLKELEQRSISSQQDTETMMKARINELLFSLEQNLTGFLNSSEQKSIESISLELNSARQLIDTYRTQQLKLIDENIVAVLERTLSIVLKNKINVKDQLDLVYEALEKAKLEKFFA